MRYDNKDEYWIYILMTLGKIFLWLFALSQLFFILAMIEISNR